MNFKTQESLNMKVFFLDCTLKESIKCIGAGKFQFQMRKEDINNFFINSIREGEKPILSRVR